MFHGPSGIEYVEIDPDHIDTEIRSSSEFDSAGIRGSLFMNDSNKRLNTPTGGSSTEYRKL